VEFIDHLHSSLDGILFMSYGGKQMEDSIMSCNVTEICLNNFSKEELYSSEKLSAIQYKHEEEVRIKREEEARRKKEASKNQALYEMKRLKSLYPEEFAEIAGFTN